ncbi:MAG: tRNA (guanosine(37)-N1)-methyltransferase TrmD, partial [Candidatus Omnitrophota bacterium]
ESMIKRAQEKKKVSIRAHDLRDYTLDKHRKVDDRPFGGGSGMVMSAEPIFRAVEALRKGRRRAQGRVILLGPQGRKLDQKAALELSALKWMILICGHYEGVDERVRAHLADEEISVGDYILTGGEIPAMALADCVVRLIPGVLGDKNSLNFESFEGNLLEYAQYTRPADFRGMKVPEILLRGDHGKISDWRREDSLRRTRQKRPDLLKKHYTV